MPSKIQLHKNPLNKSLSRFLMATVPISKPIVSHSRDLVLLRRGTRLLDGRIEDRRIALGTQGLCGREDRRLRHLVAGDGAQAVVLRGRGNGVREDLRGHLG